MKWPWALLALCWPSPESLGAEATSVHAAGWNWENFPKSNRIQIAQVPAHAGPARTEPIRAMAAGRLRISAPIAPESTLPAHTEWARIEPLEQSPEEEALRALEADLKARAQRYLDFEKHNALAQIQREIRMAQDALALAQAAEKDPKLFKGERPLLDPASRPLLTALEYKTALDSLETRKERLLQDDPRMDPPDMQSLRNELERHRARRAQQQSQLVFKQPFTGNLLLADARDARFVNAGEVIALAVSREKLGIRVKANSPLLASAAPEQLEATVTLPTGKTITAPYASAGFDPTAEGTAVLRFETALPPEIMKHISAAGIQLPASIFLKLAESCVIVPKLLVAREDRDDTLTAGWSEAIARMFPGAQLRAEGRTQLAILPLKAP